jgi:hypothetical protein
MNNLDPFTEFFNIQDSEQSTSSPTDQPVHVDGDWFETKLGGAVVRFCVQFFSSGIPARCYNFEDLPLPPQMEILWKQSGVGQYFLSIHDNGALTLRMFDTNFADYRVTPQGRVFWCCVLASPTLFLDKSEVCVARACLRVIRQWLVLHPEHTMPRGVIRLIRRVKRICRAGHRNGTPEELASFSNWSQYELNDAWTTGDRDDRGLAELLASLAKPKRPRSKRKKVQSHRRAK